MGRKIFYKTVEERKEAIRQSKLKYGKEKEWYCDICRGKIYRMAKNGNISTVNNTRKTQKKNNE